MDCNKILNNVLIFDGAMGTMLMQKGLRAGGCPEALNIDSPGTVLGVHKSYVKAKADVITTNTFGGNSLKLSLYNKEKMVHEINLRAVDIARKAAEGTGVYVAASMGPTGRLVEPAGDMDIAYAYDVFKEQARAIACGAPDFILLETFCDLGELRAALLAVKDVCDIPVICCLTYNGRRTLTGVSPAAAAVTLKGMGAAAVGANCSGGPGELYDNVIEMRDSTDLPVIVQPNAGIPYMKDGSTVFPLGPEDFKKAMEPYIDAGVNLLGSCCGSTPEHTRLLKEMSFSLSPFKRGSPDRSGSLTSWDGVLRIGPETMPLIIGERINPTSCMAVAESLKSKDYQAIRDEAEAQVSGGAHVLDINVGIPGIDRADAMQRLVNMLQRSIKAPIVIDSTDPCVIEKGLLAYHGKALVNSVNGEPKSLKSILPLVKRYGAAVIGLTLDGKGIPATAGERFCIAKEIVDECRSYGIPNRDIYIDVLTLAAGTDETAAMETLKALRMIREKLNVNTVLGISNVSYGLPQRSSINAAFLSMAIAYGLDAAIADPLNDRVMEAWRAASLLAGRDRNAQNFLARVNKNTVPKVPDKESERPASIETLREAIIKGLQDAKHITEGLIASGLRPGEVTDRALIPALNTVGLLYEEGRYYLPQLMLSAETAQRVFEVLERGIGPADTMLQKGTVVIGTVRGDIHDIGKNMVAVMLKNHGYKIIDIGKNVSPEQFVEAALKEKAQFAALSALMTTTMAEIPGTIEALKVNVPGIRVIVGGAVVNKEFARTAGADGYGSNAVDAVNVIEKLRRQ